MDMTGAFAAAFSLIIARDPQFLQIVFLSLRVTLTAVLIAALISLPLGALLGLSRFRGRSLVIIIVNALMGLPPVVAGLVVFLALSRSGPLGSLGLLFSPAAMIVAQTLLVLPIVIALTRQVVEDLWGEYAEHLTSLGQTGTRAIPTLLWDARFTLATSLLAGFGRASGYTRTMTTAIALETSKGDLALALGLGIVLIVLTLAINALAFGASRINARYAG
jgi:tungstate transport system permease protein